MDPLEESRFQVVRAIAALSGIYWETDAMKHPLLAECEQDWLLALTGFVCNYVHRHRGIPSIMRDVAEEVLGAAGVGLRAPDERFARHVWDGYQNVVRNFGLVRGNDPLMCVDETVLSGGADGGRVPATLFVLRLGEHGHNILRWTREMLEHGCVAAAAAELNLINGATRRICSYYLRDVVNHFGIPRTCPARTGTSSPWTGA